MLSVNMALWDWRNVIIEVDGKSLIVGREKECEIIKRATKWRSNILVTGVKGIGKTTMLEWSRLEPFREKFTVKIKDKITTEFKYFYNLSKAITEEIIKNRNIKEPMLKTYAEGVLKSLRNKYKYTSVYFEEVVNNYLELIESAGYELPIYIFMDDANYFSKQTMETALFRDYFKTYTSTENRIEFVIAMQLYTAKWIREKDPALYDRFNYVIPIKPLKPEEGKDMVERRLEASVKGYDTKPRYYPFTEDALERLLLEADYVPRDILRLGGIALETAMARNVDRIDEEFLKRTFKAHNVDSGTWAVNQLNSTQQLILRFLKKNGGCAKIGDIIEALNLPRTTVWINLVKMMEEEIFVKKKKRGVYCLVEEGVE